VAAANNFIFAVEVVALAVGKRRGVEEIMIR